MTVTLRRDDGREQTFRTVGEDEADPSRGTVSVSPLARDLTHRPGGTVEIVGPVLDFRDPWGNRFEIVGYNNIQFTKAPNVLRGMGLTHLSKNAQAIKELAEKGMSPI
jgi:Transcription elongation factor, GreA/GreB, C-term